jgi:hypothetical protein
MVCGIQLNSWICSGLSYEGQDYMNRKLIPIVTAAATAVVAATAGAAYIREPDPNTVSATVSGGSVPAEVSMDTTGVNRALRQAGLRVPNGWHVVDQRTGWHDETAVTVVRYEPDGTRNLGAQHVTAVMDGVGTILGYTQMAADVPSRLPSQDAARAAAERWLAGYVPGYLRGLSVEWVDRHDERIRDAAGRERVVPGMKVKARHTSGLYAWVIVDGDGEVLTYERDVRWDGAAGRRGTQMWLHDAWVAAREGNAPQPSAPYAVVR